MTRVAIVDDHRAFGERLKAFIHEQPGCSVVGIAEDATTGLEEIRTTQPDIALIDIGLPDQNGFWLAERMSESRLETQVVLMGEGESAEYTEATIGVGASMYLPKSGISQHLPALLGIDNQEQDRDVHDKEPTALKAESIHQGGSAGMSTAVAERAVMPFKHGQLITGALAGAIFLSFAESGRVELGLLAALCLLIISYRQYALSRDERGHARERELRRGRPR